MKALVTGANGLVGHALTERLVADGIPVRALSRAGLAQSNLEVVEVVQADITDAGAVDRAVAGCTHIFHLAAKVHAGEKDKAQTWHVNVEGTENIIRAARRHGVQRLVFTSSVSVYGRGVARHDIDETTKTSPDSTYAKSKLAAEALVQRESALPFVVVRLGPTVGPRAFAYVELYRKVASGQFRLLGAGNGMQSLQGLADAAEGLFLCGTVPEVDGRTYVIAGKESVPFREYVAAIKKLTGGPGLRAPTPDFPVQVLKHLDRVLFRSVGVRVPRADRLDLFLSDRTYNTARARTELGYNPRCGVQEIVQQTVGWMKSEGLLQ